MTDNKNVLRVLNGFLELSVPEKRVFVDEMIALLNEGVGTNESLNTSKKAILNVKLSANLGPTSNNNCKCCGRG